MNEDDSKDREEMCPSRPPPPPKEEEETPKSIVERISEKRKNAWRKMKDDREISHFGNMFEKCLEGLAADLYDDDFHFLFEMMQNIDDSSYSMAQSEGDKASVTFVIDPPGGPLAYSLGVSEKGCMIAHWNENGFTEKDLEAISDVRNSSKKTNEDGVKSSIGEKGIGFKSVFAVTRCPHIVSNGFEFKFDLGDTDPPDYSQSIVPRWFDSSNIWSSLNEIVFRNSPQYAEEFSKRGTLMYFPFSFPQAADGVVGDFFHRPDLLEHSILFLRNIEKYRILSWDRKESKYTLKEVQKTKLRDDRMEGNLNFQEIRVTVETDTASDSLMDWLFSDATYDVPENISSGESQFRRKGVKQMPVQVSLPLGWSSHVTRDSLAELAGCSKLHAYFPLQFRLHAPMLANSDFILTSNRDQFLSDRDSLEWNAFALEMVGQTLAKSFDYLLAQCREQDLGMGIEGLNLLYECSKSHERINMGKTTPPWQYLKQKLREIPTMWPTVVFDSQSGEELVEWKKTESTLSIGFAAKIFTGSPTQNDIVSRIFQPQQDLTCAKRIFSVDSDGKLNCPPFVHPMADEVYEKLIKLNKNMVPRSCLPVIELQNEWMCKQSFAWKVMFANCALRHEQIKRIAIVCQHETIVRSRKIQCRQTPRIISVGDTPDERDSPSKPLQIDLLQAGLLDRNRWKVIDPQFLKEIPIIKKLADRFDFMNPNDCSVETYLEDMAQAFTLNYEFPAPQGSQFSSPESQIILGHLILASNFKEKEFALIDEESAVIRKPETCLMPRGAQLSVQTCDILFPRKSEWTLLHPGYLNITEFTEKSASLRRLYSNMELSKTIKTNEERKSHIWSLLSQRVRKMPPIPEPGTSISDYFGQFCLKEHFQHKLVYNSFLEVVDAWSEGITKPLFWNDDPWVLTKDGNWVVPTMVFSTASQPCTYDKYKPLLSSTGRFAEIPSNYDAKAFLSVGMVPFEECADAAKTLLRLWCDYVSRREPSLTSNITYEFSLLCQFLCGADIASHDVLTEFRIKKLFASPQGQLIQIDKESTLFIDPDPALCKPSGESLSKIMDNIPIDDLSEIMVVINICDYFPKLKCRPGEKASKSNEIAKFLEFKLDVKRGLDNIKCSTLVNLLFLIKKQSLQCKDDPKWIIDAIREICALLVKKKGAQELTAKQGEDANFLFVPATTRWISLDEASFVSADDFPEFSIDELRKGVEDCDTMRLIKQGEAFNKKLKEDLLVRIRRVNVASCYADEIAKELVQDLEGGKKEDVVLTWLLMCYTCKEKDYFPTIGLGIKILAKLENERVFPALLRCPSGSGGTENNVIPVALVKDEAYHEISDRFKELRRHCEEDIEIVGEIVGYPLKCVSSVRCLPEAEFELFRSSNFPIELEMMISPDSFGRGKYVMVQNDLAKVIDSFERITVKSDDINQATSFLKGASIEQLQCQGDSTAVSKGNSVTEKFMERYSGSVGGNRWFDKTESDCTYLSELICDCISVISQGLTGDDVDAMMERLTIIEADKLSLSRRYFDEFEFDFQYGEVLIEKDEWYFSDACKPTDKIPSLLVMFETNDDEESKITQLEGANWLLIKAAFAFAKDEDLKLNKNDSEQDLELFADQLTHALLDRSADEFDSIIVQLRGLFSERRKRGNDDTPNVKEKIDHPPVSHSQCKSQGGRSKKSRSRKSKKGRGNRQQTLRNDNELNVVGREETIDTWETLISLPLDDAGIEKIERSLVGTSTDVVDDSAHNTEDVHSSFQTPDRRQEIGLLGEQYAAYILRQHYEDVEWENENGESYGPYDLVFTKNGSPCTAEVKTTTLSNNSFFISPAELEFARQNLDTHHLVHVCLAANPPKIHMFLLWKEICQGNVVWASNCTMKVKGSGPMT